MSSSARVPGTIMLDSASLEDVRVARGYPYVSGITTNPALVAQVSDEPLAHLARILEASSLPVFYQPSCGETDGAREEVAAATLLDPSRVIPKLPLAAAYLPLIVELREAAAPFAVTAVFSATQAVVAHEMGADWIIPYVDRARRLSSDGGQLVKTLRVLLDRVGSATRILAASLKSPEQVTLAFIDGADAVTVPLPVLTSLFDHPLTRSAVEAFVAASRGSMSDHAGGPLQ